MDKTRHMMLEDQVRIRRTEYIPRSPEDERRHLLNSNYEIMRSLSNWHAVVKKLRDKLVEQDEVLNEVIGILPKDRKC